MNWQVVAAVALIVVWAVYWKAFVKNFWKILYIVLAVAAFFFLMKLGWFCVEKAFTPRTAELQIVASGNVDPAKVVGLDSYKATYELFNSHFSQLLVILGFLGTMFGVLIPAGAYLLQRQSLKDERERMEKDFKTREDSIIEKATAAANEALAKANESLRLAEEAKKELIIAMNDNFKRLGWVFHHTATIHWGLSELFNNINSPENGKIAKENSLACYINAIILFAKAEEKEKILCVLDEIKNYELSQKIMPFKIDITDVDYLKKYLGSDFNKFKDVYNKFFEPPME